MKTNHRRLPPRHNPKREGAHGYVHTGPSTEMGFYKRLFARMFRRAWRDAIRRGEETPRAMKRCIIGLLH